MSAKPVKRAENHPSPLGSGQPEWIPRGDLTVDTRLQRPLRMGWVTAHAPIFNPDHFRPLEVSKRPGVDRRKVYIVLDGQHRLALLDAIGYQDQLVLCNVHLGLTFEQEAALFIGTNDAVKPQFLDVFAQRVNAKEEVAVAITGIAKEFGLVIGRGNTDRTIQAARSLQKVYLGDRGQGTGKNPKALRDTLWTIIAAWGEAPEAFHGAVLEGVGKMFLRDAALVDRDDLAAVLARSGSISRLIGRARDARDTHAIELARAVAGVATDLYNRKRRVNKLPSWWSYK